MGKAFTEQEREQLKIKIQDVGLKLFREKGLKKVSIRDITSEVGIAQGGFYTFYKNKEALLMALVDRRIKEKLGAVLESIPQKPEGEWKEPTQYLAGFLYNQGMALLQNKAFSNTESDSMNYIMQYRLEEKETIFSKYHSFLQELVTYWKKNGIEVEVDYPYLDGVLWTITVMIVNADIIGEQFPVIYKSFCEQQIQHIIK